MSDRRVNRSRQNATMNMKDRLRRKVAEKQPPKTICLTMIIKNEENNMVRLLDSLKPIIDMGSIVDTGSTDNSEQVILDWSKKNNIPIKVHHEPFKNFSYNRTHSIRMAKRTFPCADYFLLSDADFVWEIGEFDKKLLIDHKYLIEQYNKSISYWNIRLLSAKVDFECVGVTHEYWEESKKQSTYIGEVRTTKIKTLKIDDREDGGCKFDKFERDERLLLEGLNDVATPENLKTRYRFYLAQTLKDMERYEEAAEWYMKRIRDGGWYEEVYYSKYQLGFIYEQLGWKKRHCSFILKNKICNTEDNSNNLDDTDKEFLKRWNKNNVQIDELIKESEKYFKDAATHYLAAYDYRNTRSESLYQLTRMYRMLGLHKNAYKTAIKGRKISYPTNDSLFIEHACYDYLFDYEISIVAYYMEKYKSEGRAAISKLMDRTDIPDYMMENIENNSRFYI